MNNNEKWFEELKINTESIRTVFGEWYSTKDFKQGIPLLKVCEDYGALIALNPDDYARLIAYCEELREREMGWTITLSSLEEENEKLKEELQTFKDRWIGT